MAIALVLIAIYAVVNVVHDIEVLSYISNIENGTAASEIQAGVLTQEELVARGDGLDQRDSALTIVSWILVVLAIMSYRRWEAQRTRVPLAESDRWKVSLDKGLWFLVIASQLSRYLFSEEDLSSIKLSTWTDLVSRALILPAVPLSFYLLRVRESVAEY